VPAAPAESAGAAAAGAPAAGDGAWRVGMRGAGPLQVGMTLAEAGSALGGGVTPPAGDAQACGYPTLRGAPAGVKVMSEGGRIARVEVDSGTTPTEAGVRVGDTEARVRAAYPAMVAVTPHKYTDGHYLVVTSPAPADSAYRIVFETDGQRVTRYRAGRRPAVEYVEGCS